MIEHLSDHTERLQALQEELRQTRARLDEAIYNVEEANATLDAIRSGEVDALVVKQGSGHQIFALKTADHTFRIFIEQLTEGVVTLDQNLLILYCNSSFAGLVAVPLEKIIGQPFLHYIDVENREDGLRLLTLAWSNSSRGELNIVATNGSAVPVVIACKRLDIEEGISLSIIVTDLSTQKTQQKLLIEKNTLLEEAEKTARYLNSNLEMLVKQRTNELERSVEEKVIISEQLYHNQERLSKILETMAEGVIIMDINGDISYANRTAQLMLGLEKIEKENDGKYCSDWKMFTLEHTLLEKNEHPVYKSMVNNELIYDFEIGIEAPGKERTYLSFNAVPLSEQSHKITGAIGTFMDVTRRRISIQQKDDFIGVASHELKTPMTTIKASLQLLDRFKNNPAHEMIPRLIEQANKGMNKLSYLVEDLLDVSKIKEGQLSLKKTRFTLQQLIADSAQHLYLQNDLQVIVHGDTATEVFADPSRIEQVMVNLLNNALKYAPQSKEIIISIENIMGGIKIAVTDQGPGIETEKLEHLFNRYYRTDYSGNQISGLGLGLYISYEIIKKHGGTIGVNSTIGEGSTFWFTIPAAVV